jgi:septal ring factor EnvC (AmiA/AmiB activator)
VESLTGSFRQNRGRLPWPVDGTITGTFGARTDPVYGTTISSIGIDISTVSAAPARAVFEGTVERVGTMATYGTFVMISHGDFTTVYGNLSQVAVSRGQTVSAGQVIGRAGTSEDRRGSQLFFALFQGGSPTNPSGWLRSR